MNPGHRPQPFPILSVVVGLVTLLVGSGPVLAQTPPDPAPPAAPGAPAPPGSVGVGVQPHPYEPYTEFGFESGIPPEQKGVREQEWYPGERIRTIHQPAYLRGTTTTTRTSRTSGVRWGFSGWTAPRVLYDSQRESSGGTAFGLSIEWGTPMEPPAEEPVPPAQQR
jgi:hypothetical protein